MFSKEIILFFAKQRHIKKVSKIDIFYKKLIIWVCTCEYKIKLDL